MKIIIISDDDDDDNGNGNDNGQQQRLKQLKEFNYLDLPIFISLPYQTGVDAFTRNCIRYRFRCIHSSSDDDDFYPHEYPDHNHQYNMVLSRQSQFQKQVNNGQDIDASVIGINDDDHLHCRSDDRQLAQNHNCHYYNRQPHPNYKQRRRKQVVDKRALYPVAAVFVNGNDLNQHNWFQYFNNDSNNGFIAKNSLHFWLSLNFSIITTNLYRCLIGSNQQQIIQNVVQHCLGRHRKRTTDSASIINIHYNIEIDMDNHENDVEFCNNEKFTCFYCSTDDEYRLSLFTDNQFYRPDFCCNHYRLVSDKKIENNIHQYKKDFNMDHHDHRIKQKETTILTMNNNNNNCISSSKKPHQKDNKLTNIITEQQPLTSSSLTNKMNRKSSCFRTKKSITSTTSTSTSSCSSTTLHNRSFMFILATFLIMISCCCQLLNVPQTSMATVISRKSK